MRADTRHTAHLPSPQGVQDLRFQSPGRSWAGPGDGGRGGGGIPWAPVPREGGALEHTKGKGFTVPLAENLGLMSCLDMRAGRDGGGEPLPSSAAKSRTSKA